MEWDKFLFAQYSLKVTTCCEQRQKCKQTPLLKPLPFLLLAPLTEPAKNTKLMCSVQFPTNETGDSFNLLRKNLLQSLRAAGTS